MTRKMKRKCLTRKRALMICVCASLTMFLLGHIVADSLLSAEHAPFSRGLKSNAAANEEEAPPGAGHAPVVRMLDNSNNNIVIEQEITVINPQRTKRPVGERLVNIETDIDKNESIVHAPDEWSLSKPKPILADRKYVIYYCADNRVCGGWGDRQNGILSSYLWAECTDREFGIIMPSPCELNKFLVPNKVNWIVNKTELKANFKTRTSKFIFALNDDAFRKSVASRNLNAEYPQDFIVVRLNYNFIHSFKRNALFNHCLRKIGTRKGNEIFAQLYKRLFKLSPPVEHRIESLLSTAKPTRRHKLVCAHVRLGRNPTIPFDSKVFNTIEYTETIWDFMNRYQKDMYVRYFFTSDSEQLQKRAIELFGDRLLQIPGKIIHIDHVRTAKADDLCDGFEKVILDQELLTRCDILIISESVFSRNAAVFRGKEDGLYLFVNGTVIKKSL